MNKLKNAAHLLSLSRWLSFDMAKYQAYEHSMWKEAALYREGRTKILDDSHLVFTLDDGTEIKINIDMDKGVEANAWDVRYSVYLDSDNCKRFYAYFCFPYCYLHSDRGVKQIERFDSFNSAFVKELIVSGDMEVIKSLGLSFYNSEFVDNDRRFVFIKESELVYYFKDSFRKEVMAFYIMPTDDYIDGFTSTYFYTSYRFDYRFLACKFKGKFFIDVGKRFVSMKISDFDGTSIEKFLNSCTLEIAELLGYYDVGQ